MTGSADAAASDRPRRGGQTKAKAGRTVIWQQQVPIRITAMVRTAEKLFVAGSPDLLDSGGRQEGVLAVFNAADGEKLAEIKLDAPPVCYGSK